MPRVIAVLALLVGLLAVRTASAEGCFANDGLVPANVASEDELVPLGARAEYRTAGDLDGDGRDDVALLLTGLAHDEQWNHEYTLVIACAVPTGFATVAVRHCVPALQDFSGSIHSAELSINRGVLSVRWVWGFHVTWGNSNLRFRLDSIRARMMLIGIDERYDDGSSTSVNLLTGEWIVTRAVEVAGRLRHRSTRGTDASMRPVDVEQLDRALQRTPPAGMLQRLARSR